MRDHQAPAGLGSIATRLGWRSGNELVAVCDGDRLTLQAARFAEEVAGGRLRLDSKQRVLLPRHLTDWVGLRPGGQAPYDTVQAELEERRRRVHARHLAPPALAGPGITFVATVDIARPPEEMFGYVADLTRPPQLELLGPLGPAGHSRSGARQHGLPPGPAQRQAARPDRCPRGPHRIALATLDGSRPRFTRDIQLRPTGDGGTQLVDRWQLDTGHPAAVQRLLASRIRTGVTDNLTRLTELLETGQTLLPDGRPVRWSGADPTTA